MTTQSMELATLAKLAEAKANFSVSVLADKDGWTVCVHDEARDYVLLDQTGKAAAVFDALEAVERHLRAAGIVQFEVDGRKDRRSDGSGYDAWFRRQVQAAFDDPSPPIPHDEAMRLIQAAIELDKPSPADSMAKENGFVGRQMRYRVALRQSEEGFSVWVPALAGCQSQGATEEEAIDNIRIAIEEYLSVFEEQFHDSEVKEVEVTVLCQTL